MKNPIVQFFGIFIPSEKNVMKSKHDILKLLFSDCTTKQSIDLLKEVQTDFATELSKRYLDAQIEISTIDNFMASNKQLF